jgi:hypothetical protein
VNRVALDANWEVVAAAQLTYWGTWAEQNAGNSKGMNVVDLLTQSDGKCESWARLFAEVLGAQGITSGIKLKEVRPVALQSQGVIVNVQGMVIKNVTFGGTTVNPPFGGTAYTTIASEASIPAQNNNNARIRFTNHIIVGIGTKLYDPSYGGEYDSLDGWEAASLAGIGFEIILPQGRARLTLANRADTADVRITAETTP